MSSNGKRVRKPEPYVCGKDTPQQPGDSCKAGGRASGCFEMDADFVAQMVRVLWLGLERWPEGCKSRVVRAKARILLRLRLNRYVTAM
jgi:hypothetical protein